MNELSDGLLDAVCALAEKRPSPKTTMDIWPMAGAAARVPAQHGLVGGRARLEQQRQRAERERGDLGRKFTRIGHQPVGRSLHMK